jgi:enamine deaminase RidA (YjgF/YER057c/UK114 family)
MPIYTNSVIVNGPFLFISGQTPMDNGFIPENILEQTKIVLKKNSASID